MRNYKNYTRYPVKSKWTVFVLISVVVALLLLFLLEALGMFDEPMWQPDRVYPMANAQIGWNQTWHPGSWSDAR